MPQLEVETYVGQLFWLVVTFAVLYVVIVTLALPRIRSILENRQSRRDQDLQRAASLKDEAAAVKDAYEAEISQAHTKAHEEMRSVTQEISNAATARHDTLSESIAKDLAAAEQRIAQARDDALANIEDVAREIVVSAAQKLGGVSIGQDQVSAAVASASGGHS